ncbi:cathepsin O [Esox lucius]|uniref:Cathepsin O n=1 Tax=Esox lucius TaxID=8010 RepID=A0A3P8YYF5_ESOLU|nr:cathepsin O [Esox lucius]
MTIATLFLIFLLNLLGDVTPKSRVWETVRKSNFSADTDVYFKSFRELFNRTYKLPSDYYRSKSYFKNSIKRHAYLNSFSATPNCAKYGINQFSDLSVKEFRELYLTASVATTLPYSGLKTGGLPAKFDWRDKGAVGPVQNQQACGGCWAFSVVGIIESAKARSVQPWEPLSVQQVIDCSYKNQGCNGGITTRALGWLNQTKLKLVKQSEYPFKAQTGICHFFPQSHDGVSVKDFAAYNFSGREKAMMGRLVAWGPLAVTVDALSWQDYLGGIIQHHCSYHHANHAVIVIGYDATGEVPYWIVQNSWGTSWGNEGYAYIKMGGNVCGIADSVSAVFL